MPQPQAASLHIDQFLTQVSVGYAQDAGNFVADMAFPNVASPKQSNKIAIYSQADLYRDEMVRRAPGAESGGGGYSVSNATFYCDVFASHIDVDDQTVAAADNPYAPAQDAVRVLVQREKIRKERQFGTDFFTTSLWTGGTSADPTAAQLSGAWDDPASTPIEDIHDQSNSILVKTGFKPNTLVINNLGWNSLKNHPDVVDRVKYVSSEPVNPGAVANLLDVDRILISRAVYTTSEEGLTGTYASALGNHALLCYAGSPGLFQPSAGWTFTWSGYPGSADGRRIKRFRMEELASERVEIESAFDMKVINANLGVFIQSVAS